MDDHRPDAVYGGTPFALGGEGEACRDGESADLEDRNDSNVNVRNEAPLNTVEPAEPTSQPASSTLHHSHSHGHDGDDLHENSESKNNTCSRRTTNNGCGLQSPVRAGMPS